MNGKGKILVYCSKFKWKSFFFVISNRTIWIIVRFGQNKCLPKFQTIWSIKNASSMSLVILKKKKDLLFNFYILQNYKEHKSFSDYTWLLIIIKIINYKVLFVHELLEFFVCGKSTSLCDATLFE